MTERDWTPQLSSDGVFYCSPACGSGRFCRKEWHDRAVRLADEAAAMLGGEGWTPNIWENLGWHCSVKNGCITIHIHPSNGAVTYAAWIEPGVVLCNAAVQVISPYCATPNEALKLAQEEALKVIGAMGSAMTVLQQCTTVKS